MRLISALCAAALLMMLGLACNTVSPDQCWPNTSGGLGGSEMIPIGAGVGATTGGDYLTPPRRPLDDGDEPNPCIVQESPCVQKCLDDYEKAVIACGKITDEAQEHACSEGARATYKSCDASCRQQINSTCQEKFEDCQNNAPSFCLKKDANKSLCNRCLERCNAGDSPSYKCRRCRF